MDDKQKSAFWSLIKTLDDKGLLPYVAITGSWAEYIYQDYFKTGFKASVRTYDLDIFYPNIRKPNHKIDLATALKEKGFEYKEDPITGVGRFVKGGELDVDILTRAIGAGSESVNMIGSLNIKAQGMRDMNMFEPYIIFVQSNNMKIPVPAPAAYVLQKLYINPHRVPAHKREKDIAAVRVLLEHIKSSPDEINNLKHIFGSLTAKQQKTIKEVADQNKLHLFEAKESVREKLNEAKRQPHVSAKKINSRDKHIHR